MLRKRTSEKIAKQQSENKRRYDLRRAPPKTFKIGDAVGALREAPSDGESKKLKRPYAGPYEVKAVLDRDRYEIGDIKGAQRTQKPYTGVFPTGKLKLWEFLTSSGEEENSDEEGDPLRKKVRIGPLHRESE